MIQRRDEADEEVARDLVVTGGEGRPRLRAEIGIGGSLTASPLPHHRAYGSVHGGSVNYAA